MEPNSIKGLDRAASRHPRPPGSSVKKITNLNGHRIQIHVTMLRTGQKRAANVRPALHTANDLALLDGLVEEDPKTATLELRALLLRRVAMID